jgi:hypothetical protein
MYAGAGACKMHAYTGIAKMLVCVAQCALTRLMD